MSSPVAAPAVERVRRRLGGQVRTFLSGSSEPPRAIEPREDDGLFGPHSVTWRVHSDAAMLVGGLRALLVQTLHPLAMAGVADHSDYRDDPWGRLHRTGHYVGVTTFGSTGQAHDAIAAVRAIHRRVRGVSSDGRPYSATDPDLVTWVHVTEVDSFLTAVRRYGRTDLTGADADRYVAEMAVLGEAMGGADVPRSTAEVAAFYAAVRPELKVGRQARAAVRFLLNPPVAAPLRPAYGVVTAAAVAALPGFARRLLVLPVPPLVEPLVVRPAAAALLGALDWVLTPADGDPVPTR